MGWGRSALSRRSACFWLVFLSIPKSVSLPTPNSANRGGNKKEGGPAVNNKEVLLLLILKGVVVGFEPDLDGAEGTDLPRPNSTQRSADAAAARIMDLGSAGTGDCWAGGNGHGWGNVLHALLGPGFCCPCVNWSEPGQGT